MLFLKLNFLTILLFIVSVKFCICQDYDALIFVQQWPSTFCVSDNLCRLPSDKGTWTIHGIWPSKFGSFGPESCDISSKFDLNALQPLRDKLENYWPSIEGKSNDAFWRHEWEKHGTCAKLGNLDTQTKYFAQALSWLSEYNMAKLLAKNDIIPGNTYSPLSIQTAIKNELNTNPSIRCVKGKDKGEMYLKEIYLCFNKQLELVDCKGATNRDKIITNCFSNVINYPSSVPGDGTNFNFIYYLFAIIFVVLAIIVIKRYRNGERLELSRLLNRS